jgi:hypothetical protein
MASGAVLSVGLAFVILMARSRALSPAARCLSLSGLRSFAVVPLHYFLLDVAIEAMGAPVDSTTFLRIFLPVLVLSFLGSEGFVRVSSVLEKTASRVPDWAIVLALAAVYYGLLRGTMSGLTGIAVGALYQLALCVVLSFRARSSGRG